MQEKLENVYNQYIFLPYVFTTIIGIFSSHSKFDKVIRVFSLISVAITRSKFVRKSGRLLSTCSTDSSTQSPLTSGFNSDNNLIVKKRRKMAILICTSIAIYYRLPSSKSRQITSGQQINFLRCFSVLPLFKTISF